ncbi:ABC transporter substrate-binding protein, partial [Myxococcota bacterium]|nr:ABC transporter substrate-binding protein [Myxococcota bacterium]
AEAPDAVCAAGACRHLASLGCRWSAGPRDVATALVGAFLPLDGDIAAVLPDLEPAAALAVEDWNEAGRTIGLVTCNAGSTRESAIAAFGAVVELGLSAVIGPVTSAQTRGVALDPTAAGRLLLSPSATSPELERGLPSPELVWRLAPSDARQLVPLAALPAVATATTGHVVVALDDPLGEQLLPRFQQVVTARSGAPWPASRPTTNDAATILAAVRSVAPSPR